MGVRDLAAKMETKYGLVSQGATASALTGRYLADVIRFMLGRIPEKSRQAAIQNLKGKIRVLNENEIAHKRMPPMAALGQSITLVKSALFGSNATYVREVLNAIVANL
jgi:hypothetical protein